MTPGFQSEGFRVYTPDGRNFVLLRDELYLSVSGVLYVLPMGGTSDGASVPAAFWITLPPFGSYWRGAVLHDFAYRDTLMVEKPDNSRLFATLTESQSNELLLEAMKSCGTHEITRDEIYKGVCLGGASSFANDRSAGRNSFMRDVTIPTLLA